jgi:diketogulonate reductase-like aldo/keto reductase
MNLGTPRENKLNGGREIERKSPLIDPVVGKISEKYAKSPAQILLRHFLQEGTPVVVNSSNTKRMSENLNVFDFNLSVVDMERLKRLDAGVEHVRRLNMHNF